MHRLMLKKYSEEKSKYTFASFVSTFLRAAFAMGFANRQPCNMCCNMMQCYHNAIPEHKIRTYLGNTLLLLEMLFLVCHVGDNFNLIQFNERTASHLQVAFIEV